MCLQVLCIWYFYIHRHSRVQTHDSHSWGLIGKCLYYPKLRYIQTTILHNVQSQHFVRGKGRWEEMRWPDGGMVGPRMECWLTVGRADRGLGPEWMWGWNAVAMGTVKWRWEARWNNFIDYLTVHIYKHNIPPLVGKEVDSDSKNWDVEKELNQKKDQGRKNQGGTS